MWAAPIAAASSRKYNATRPEPRPIAPAPTHTTSPLAHKTVHPRLRVRADPPRQHVALPDLRGQRQPLQRHEHLAQAVDSRARAGVAIDALPRGQKGRQGLRIGRLDLFAQSGQRGPPEAAQDLHIAPLAIGASGAELAAERARRRAPDSRSTALRVDAVARAQLLARERPVRAGVARDELVQRVGHIPQERLRQAAGRDGAERVAIQPRLVGRDDSAPRPPRARGSRAARAPARVAVPQIQSPQTRARRPHRR